MSLELWQQTAGYDLAKQIASIAGQAEEFERTGWGGATRRAQRWLDAGWPKDLVTEAVKQMMRTKRDGPPISIKYFEKGVANYLAQQNAPLPNVVQLKPQTVQVAHGKAGRRPREPWQQRRDTWFEALADFSEGVAALSKQMLKAAKAAQSLFAIIPPAPMGDSKAYMTMVVKVFAEYPENVMIQAVEKIAVQTNNPTLKLIKDTCEEVYEPIRRNEESKQRERDREMALPPPRHKRTPEEQARIDAQVTAVRAQFSIRKAESSDRINARKCARRPPPRPYPQ